MQMKPVEEWSQNALDTIQHLITISSNTFFHIKEIFENYCFGEITLSVNGNSLSWTSILSELHEIETVKFTEGKMRNPVSYRLGDDMHFA